MGAQTTRKSTQSQRKASWRFSKANGPGSFIYKPRISNRIEFLNCKMTLNLRRDSGKFVNTSKWLTEKRYLIPTPTIRRTTTSKLVRIGFRAMSYGALRLKLLTLEVVVKPAMKKSRVWKTTKWSFKYRQTPSKVLDWIGKPIMDEDRNRRKQYARVLNATLRCTEPRNARSLNWQ